MDGNPTSWLEIQPTTKFRKTKSSRLWPCYIYVALESSTIYFGIVWLIWPCLKGNHLSLSNIKTGFNHSLDGFPTIKISQKMEKANLWPQFLRWLSWEWSKLIVYVYTYVFQLTQCKKNHHSYWNEKSLILKPKNRVWCSGECSYREGFRNPS